MILKYVKVQMPSHVCIPFFMYSLELFSSDVKNKNLDKETLEFVWIERHMLYQYKWWKLQERKMVDFSISR